uniref:Uncharacterized protein n=1 Tax=Rhizophora mucronata TaxID=61149 RepID=A0A2P2NMX6_RHIMU
MDKMKMSTDILCVHKILIK